MDGDDFTPVPLGADQIPMQPERVRGWALVLIAAVGVGLVVSGAWTALTLPDLPQVWSSLQIDIGIGVLLFALLFQVERVIVRRHVDPLRQYLEEITPQSVAELARKSPGDLARVGDAEGPVAKAFEWTEAMLSGDHDTLWELSDENWRLCRAQAWIYNNLGALGLQGLDEAAEMAHRLVAGPGCDVHWEDFSASERDQFLAAWPGMAPGDLGAASKRRCVGPGYELVVMTPMGSRRQGYVVNAPSVLPSSLLLLMGKTEGE